MKKLKLTTHIKSIAVSEELWEWSWEAESLFDFQTEETSTSSSLKLSELTPTC